MSNRLLKVFRNLGYFLLVFSLCYFGYAALIKKSNADLDLEKRNYEQKIADQDLVLKDLKVQANKLSEEQDLRTQKFIQEQGFHPNELNNLSLKKEITRYKKAQEDIIKKLQAFIQSPDFQHDFYEEDDMVVFLGKYSDLSSSSRSEKHRGNLWEELNASAILNRILEDPLYARFYHDNPGASVRLKTSLLHQAYLGYDLYRLSNIKLKNLDDLRIAFDLYVHELENLQNNGFNVEAFHLDSLRAQRSEFQKAYKTYLEYEGIINQLEELQNEGDF